MTPVMSAPKYTNFGRKQAESGALKNVLGYLGVINPITKKPFTEEMLFGIGGGIGITYFAFEFSDRKAVVVGTRIHTPMETKNAEFIQRICNRIGISCQMKTSSNEKAAQNSLKKALDKGQKPIVWVNPEALPYLPRLQNLFCYYPIVIYGYDDEENLVYVSDRRDGPLTMSQSNLAASRLSDWSPRFRYCLVDLPFKGSDLPKAIVSGLRDFCEHMVSPPISNFGLKGLRKWGNLLETSRDKKSWPIFLLPGSELFSALVSVFNQIENRGDGGSAFRPMFVEFLIEASVILKEPRFHEVADLFRESADLWSTLSNAILPDEIKLFKETKQLLTSWRKHLDKKGDVDLAGMNVGVDRLATIEKQIKSHWPLPQDELKDFFSSLKDIVMNIHNVEEKAVLKLENILN